MKNLNRYTKVLNHLFDLELFIIKVIHRIK